MNFVTAGKISEPIYCCPMHKHAEWEIIYQHSGNTCAHVDGAEFNLQEGNLIVIPPNTPHKTVSDMLILDMHIRLNICDFPTYPFTVKDNINYIRNLYFMILTAYFEKEEGYEIFTEKLSELICLYIKKSIDKYPCPQFISDFKRTVANNIENPKFNITESIKRSGYHPDYFRRIFKKHVGSSPHNYLIELRIAYAKDLLKQERHLTIGEVSQRCGFNDNLYFSTCFKQKVGVSPLTFKMHKTT